MIYPKKAWQRVSEWWPEISECGFYMCVGWDVRKTDDFKVADKRRKMYSVLFNNITGLVWVVT